MSKFLDNCASYRRYLNEVPTGNLALPAYELNSDGEAIVHPGEVFCRVPHCPKGRNGFTKTVNLRVHIGSHAGVKVAGGKNGRISMAEIDNAIAWFNALFYKEEEPVVTPTPAAAKLYAPWKRDETRFNINKIRAKAREMGVAIPCSGCKAVRKRCPNNDDECRIVDDHFEVLAPTDL